MFFSVTHIERDRKHFLKDKYLVAFHFTISSFASKYKMCIGWLPMELIINRLRMNKNIYND